MIAIAVIIAITTFRPPVSSMFSPTAANAKTTYCLVVTFVYEFWRSRNQKRLHCNSLCIGKVDLNSSMWHNCTNVSVILMPFSIIHCVFNENENTRRSVLVVLRIVYIYFCYKHTILSKLPAAADVNCRPIIIESAMMH